MAPSIHLLLVEPDELDRQRIHKVLRGHETPFRVSDASDLDDIPAQLSNGRFDVALVDLDGWPQSFDGFDRVRSLAPDLPIAVLAGDEAGTAAEAVRRGADGFVVKTEQDLALLHVMLLAVIERAAERAQRQALLRQVQSSENRYRLLFDNIQDALLLCDADGKIVQVNQSAAGLLDQSASRLAGTPLLHWIKGDVPATLSELAASEASRTGLSLRRQPIPVEVRVSSLMLDDQPAYLVTLRDLRHEARAAQLLRALTAAAAAMQGALTPLDVFRAAGEQLRSIGLILSVFRYLEDENAVVMLHTELAGRVLAYTRRLTGLDPMAYRIPLDRSPVIQSVLTSDASLILPDAVQVIGEMLPDRLKRLAGPLQKVMGYGEQFGLRLHLSGRVYGLIFVGYSEGQLTESDRPVIDAFASQIQAALERSQRFEATQSRLAVKLQELTHLVRVGKQMQLRLPLDSLLDMICGAVRDGLGWDRVVVWLRDEQTLALRQRAAQGVSAPHEPDLAGLDESVWRKSDYRLGRAYFMPRGDPSTLRLHSGQASLPAPSGRGLRRAGPATQAWQPGDLLVIPIEIGGELLGAIQVDRPYGGQRPTANDLMSLELSANLAAVAVENALLYERARARLEQRTEELTALTALSAVADQADLHASLEHALVQVLRVSGMDAAGISLLDPPTGELWPDVRHDVSDTLWKVLQASPIRIGDGVGGRALAAGRTIIVTDVANDPRVAYRDALLEDGIQTVVGIGLMGRHPVGSMSLYAHAACRLTDETLDWLTVAGRQIALSIENTRLIESIRRRQQMAEAVREVNAVVASNLELEAVLAAILDQVSRVVPYVMARILLVDENELRVIAARGQTDSSQRLGQAYPRDERNPAWQAVLSREVQVIGDVQPPESDTRSHISAPLIVHDEVIGVLMLDHGEPGSYTEESARTAALIAQQAAVAIDNARRYQETQARAGNLSMLLAASREFGSSLDSDQVLGRLAQWLASAVDATSARVYAWDMPAGMSRLVAQYVGARASAIERQSMVGVEQRLDEMPKLVEAMKTRQLLAYGGDDAQIDLLLMVALQRRGVASALYLPLIVRERLIGYVEVWETGRARVWKPDEIRMCQTLANVAASAIDNARLFEAERQRRAVAETVRDLAAVISSSLELQPVLEALLDRAAELIPYDSAAVYISPRSLDGTEAPDQLRIAASRGLPPEPTADSFHLPSGSLAGEVLRSREVTLYADVRDLAGWARTPDTEYVRGWLGAPLKVKGQVIGVLALDSRTPGRYRREHAEIAEMIANHASVAIENARLYQETRQRLAELETLQVVSLEMIQSLDLRGVSQAIADGALRLLEATAVHVFRFDAESDALHMVAASAAPGYEDVGQPTPRREGLTMHVAHNGRLVVVNDPRSDPVWAAITQAWPVDLQAIASLPLRIRNRVVGVMNVIFHVPHTIDDNEVRIMSLLADQAATALENARLFQAEQRRAQQLALVNRVGLDVTSILDLDQLAQTVVEEIRRAFNCYFVSLVTIDDDSMVWRSGAGGDVPGWTPAGLRQPVGVGITGAAAASGEVVWVPDVRFDPRYRTVPQVQRTLSEVALPLRVRETLIGVLDVQSDRTNAFSDEDLTVLMALAGQLSVAVENALLYQALAQHAASLEARVAERTAEIQREQERTITILNSVADAVLVTDLQGTLMLTNPVAEALLREDEHGEQPGRLRAWLREQTPHDPAPKIDAGGRTLQAAVAYIHEDDQPMGHVIVLRDITRLEEVDRLKTQFVANVSHELRTPLTNIKLYLGLIQKGRLEKREQYLVTLQNEANRLERLITDLLDLSRLERDRHTAIREVVDLAEVLRHVVATLGPQAEAKQQTLRLEIGEPLPELPADRNQFIQVFVNLTANAINYTPPGGRVTLQAATQERDGQRWVAVAVSDSGVGIPAEDRDRIFDRFYRGRAEHSTVHGTGLGLSIVKEIVDKHSGQITMESQVGQGSTFTIWLPIH